MNGAESSLPDRISVFLATGFGASSLWTSFHSRFDYVNQRKEAFRGTGAGLIGTLEAVAFVTLGLYFDSVPAVLALILLSTASIYVCGRAEKLLGSKDDSRIVLDEIVGYFWSVAFLPLGAMSFGFRFAYIVAAFVLFRIFDVYKIPSRRIQSVKGGLGVMADDILSGLLSSVILNLSLYFL